MGREMGKMRVCGWLLKGWMRHPEGGLLVLGEEIEELLQTALVGLLATRGSRVSGRIFWVVRELAADRSQLRRILRQDDDIWISDAGQSAPGWKQQVLQDGWGVCGLGAGGGRSGEAGADGRFSPFSRVGHRRQRQSGPALCRAC
jgi:hypothetical protein